MAGDVDSTVLDRDALEELREELGAGYPAFVRQFLDKASQTMDELGVAVRAREGASVAARAHSLKGTAGYLGAVDLTARLGTLERLAESGDLEAAATVLEQAREAFEQVAPALSASASES